MIRANSNCSCELKVCFTTTQDITGYLIKSDGATIGVLEFHRAEGQWTIETHEPMTAGFVAKVFETLTAQLPHEQYVL